MMRIIGLAPNKWHGQWVNRQQLLSRLGVEHTVLYSNGAWFGWDRALPIWHKAKLLGAVDRTDNVAVEEAPKLLLRWPRWRHLDQLAIRVHAMRLRRLVSHDSSPLVSIIFHPSFFPYAQYLRSQCLAYHAYDLFEATPGWNSELDSLESILLRQADLVTASSESIAARLSEKGGREIRLLPNGVDLAAFGAISPDRAAIPDDLARIARPRLGYVGSLHPQIDFPLVAKLAKMRPGWSFVFVGGGPAIRDGAAANELEDCRKHANIHFLGHKHRSEVPAYISNMDVNLMLYRIAEDTWINAGYPLKLHEYLAIGLPVVSADIPAVREFADVVRIAKGFPDWIQAIEEALSSGGTGSEVERRAVAAENSWDARADLLQEWLAALTDQWACRDTGAPSAGSEAGNSDP